MAPDMGRKNFFSRRASAYELDLRLERKYGRFCIPNLISIIVGGQILVYAIELFVNQFISSLSRPEPEPAADGAGVAAHHLRLYPVFGGGPLSVILGIYFTWFIGTALEKEWGDFRFNLYFLLGMIGTVLGCLVTGIPRRHLLPVAVAAAGFRHALPRGAGAAVLRHPGKGEVFRSLRRCHVAVQLPDCRVAV